MAYKTFIETVWKENMCACMDVLVCKYMTQITVTYLAEVGKREYKGVSQVPSSHLFYELFPKSFTATTNQQIETKGQTDRGGRRRKEIGERREGRDSSRARRTNPIPVLCQRLLCVTGPSPALL